MKQTEGTSTWTLLVSSQLLAEEWVNTIQQYILKVELQTPFVFYKGT